MVTALFAAGLGRRRFLYAWTALFAVVALAGLADFWYWGYDYGHDLDPTAAIKVPGLSYQPPLIGSKRLLNFTAHSWPGLGGWALVAALLIGIALSFLEFRRGRHQAAYRPASGAVRAAAHSISGVAVLVSIVTSGCSAPAPVSFHYDSDACDHCRMTISQPAFAAQIVTRTGKVFRFDDPACLAAFTASDRIPARDVHSIWANDYAHPDVRVQVDDAVFVVSDGIRAPMNGQIAVFASRDDARALAARLGGRLASWADVKKRVAS